MHRLKVKALLLIALLSAPPLGLSLECASSQCYLLAYDKATPSSTPDLQRVTDIYATMTRTIGSTQAMRSKLIVIESERSPWAVALSDNTIVLTSGTVKAIYRDSSVDIGDARAAFIIGHELSHLETEDLFHHRAFLANENQSSAIQFFQQRPDEEIRADLRGFTYATIAGFKTHQLLVGKSDFFRTWLPNSNALNSKTHPDNTERSHYLAQGFNDILRDASYYRYATLLAHFGRYPEAQLLFEDFLNRAETAEAFSNLGYVHLQRAREAMPVSMAYKYWIPTVLEPADGLNIPRERRLFDQALPASALQHLTKAEQYLKQAVNMNSDLLVSHINLAAVYLYIPDKIHRAFASMEDAKRTQLGSIPAIRNQLTSIDNLIRIEINNDDNTQWSKAHNALTELATLPNVSDNLLYNFARMLDDQGNDNQAVQYWQKLYKRLDTLPAPYQAQVCFRLTQTTCNIKKHEAFPLTPLHPQLSQDVRYPGVRQYLSNEWNTNNPGAKALPDLIAQVYLNSQGDSLLALNNQIDMMVVRNIPAEYNQVSKLQARFGLPTVSLPLNGGQILSYGGQWAAQVENNNVIEIWISNIAGVDSGN